MFYSFLPAPHLVIWVLVSCLLASPVQAQLQVNSTLTPEQYVNDILLGAGIEATNIQLTGSPVQIGHITGFNADEFPITEGLILSTEVANNPANVNSGCLDDIINDGQEVSGDPDLLNIANSVPPLIGQNFNVSSVNDLCIIEFDFVATGDSIKFNYVFGSDEYLEWVNSQYNDIFGFFLDGPGIVGPYANGAVNLAEVPGSDPQLPITISSVNNQINNDFYIDNPGNNILCQDGYTVALTARSAVQCGETYHIRLAIADGTDTALESIVILEAGSFQSNGANIEASASIGGAPVFLGDTVVVEGCNQAAFTVIRPVTTFADTLELFISGTAESGVDFVPIDTAIIMEVGVSEQQILLEVIDDNLEEGTESVTLEYLYVNLCGDTSIASATLLIQDPDPLTVQVPDEVALCPPVQISASVTQGYAPFLFGWSTGDSSSTITYNGLEPTTIFLTVTDVCSDSLVIPIDLVNPTPLEVSIVQVDAPYCPGDPVQLTTEVLSGSGTVNWDWSSNVDNSNGGNANVSPATNETFTVNAEDACSQTDEASWTVVVPTYEPITSDDVTFCLYQQGVLGIDGGTLLYTFTGLDGVVFNAETDSTVVFTNGTGSMYVGGANTTTTVVITDECGSSINIEVTSEACETIVPNVFTPNNDGENDRFVIDGIEGYPGSSLRVFNRWGSEVFFDSNYDSTWDADGLSDGTYYYLFDRSDGMSFRGSLKIMRKRS
jgi:gliding motility-associated-like protein